MRHDAEVTDAERDSAVDDFIDLVNAVDGILVQQATADANYFAFGCGRRVGAQEMKSIETGFRDAYRWTYIHSGAQHRRFTERLSAMVTEAQAGRIEAALKVLH